MALSGTVNTTSYDGRYYQLSWTATQSVANNTSTISWTLKALGGTSSWYAERTLKVVLAGTTIYSKTSRVERYTGTIATGTKTISHNSSGAASFSVSLQAAVYVSTVNCTGSGSFTLNTIPRKSTLSVGNGTLGTAQTLTVTRLSSSFTHTIVATCGSASTTICTKSSTTSISFTPPLSWANQNTTGTSVTVKYTITTYSGSTNVGSNSYTKTCSIPSSVKPSVTFTVSEATSLNWGVYVQGVSKLKITLSVTTSYGSAISSYKTTVNGKTYTSSSFTTSVLTSSGNLTIKTTVTDKRGRTGTYSQTINVIAYAEPKFSYMKVHRCNENGTENMQGEYGMISFESACSPLLAGSTYKNNISFKVEYKKTSDLEYTLHETITHGIIPTGNTGVLSSIFPAESGASYHIRLTVIDSFNSIAVTTVLSTAFSLIHWLSNGLGIAFGKLSELTNVLDIGFKTRFSGGILHPVLEADTDLNNVLTPNTYVGANISNYNYANVPAGLTSGTFTLEVVGMGADGQLKQKITYCHKTLSRSWERIYYSSSWGNWICVSDFNGKVLWSGGMYMTAGHTINLSEAVSKQSKGIALVFSLYTNGATSDAEWVIHEIPKYMIINHPSGGGYAFECNTGFRNALKYLYITDTSIRGHDNNNQTKTVDGITYTNGMMVLRYVLGI